LCFFFLLFFRFAIAQNASALVAIAESILKGRKNLNGNGMRNGKLSGQNRK
jgi:hypothetical protein